jgi:hypothetical protein
MQHCNNSVFLDDRHCPHCGDALTHNEPVKSVLDIYPELRDKIASKYPHTFLFTGILQNTYHYQRGYKKGGAHSEDVSFSYWWLEIRDNEGKTLGINIESENNNIDSLKTGTVLTVLRPGDIKCPSKFKNKSDREIVKIIDRYYIPEEVSYWKSLLIASIAALSISAIMNLKSTWTAAGVWLGSFILMQTTERFNYKAKKASYETIKNATRQISSISLNQMGYDLWQRPASNDDLLCGLCEHPLGSTLAYCTACGEKQTVETILTSSKPLSNADSTEVTGNQRVSRNEHLADYLAQFSCQNEGEFVYKHVLLPDEQGQVQGQIDIVKVLDKKVRSVTHNSSSSTETTTKTDYYLKGGVYLGSDTKTELSSSHYFRSSSLDGHFLVEFPGQEPQELPAPNDILARTDIGDWLAVGTNNLTLKGCSYPCREFYYNLQQDFTSRPTSIKNYSNISYWWTKLSFVLLCVVGFIYFDSGNDIPLKTYTALQVVILLLASINGIRNYVCKKRLTVRFDDGYKKIKESRGDIVNFLKKMD